MKLNINKAKILLNNFYFVFWGVFLAGNIILGLISGLFVGSYLYIYLGFLTKLYILYSLVMVFVTSKDLSIYHTRILYLFLGFYITLSAISMFLLGTMSPLFFIGLILSNYFMGVDISGLSPRIFLMVLRREVC